MKFYTEYVTNDKAMVHTLFGYCEGRSRFWQMFLGWRSTRRDGEDEFYRFIIPTRKVEELETIAYLIRKDVNRD